MTRVVLLAFLLFVSAPPFAPASLTDQNTVTGQRHVYLLSSPIQKTVTGNCMVLGAIWAMNLSWAATVVGGSYLCFRNPVSAGMLSAYYLTSDYFYASHEIRTANELTARWQNRKDLRKIAAATRAENLRVITTGQNEQTGIFNSRLSSNSFVFVETTSDLPPAPYEGREWIPVGDVEQTKVRLELRLPGAMDVPPTLEVSLRDIFTGTKIPQEIETAWRAAINDWNTQLPAWDRLLSHDTFNTHARVTAALVRGDEVVPLGDYVKGAGVRKVLGITWKQRLVQLLTGRGISGKIRTQTISVHDSANCSKWYRRLLGREILLPR